MIARSIAAIGLAVLATPGPAPADEPRGAPPIRLRVQVAPYMSYGPFFIAEAEGYFAEQGLDVEFVRLPGSLDGLPPLAQGALDVVASFLAPGYFNVMARGAEVRFVADKGHAATEGCAYRGMLARRSLVESGELETFAQLRGKVVAVERTAPSYYEVSKMLELGGLTEDDVRTVDVPVAAKLRAFERGSIDVTTASEPWITRIVDTGHAVLWKPLREIDPGYQHSFVLFGPNLLRKNRDAGVRFLAGYLKAVRQYNEGNTERNVQIVAEGTGLDPELVVRTCWPPVREDGSMNVQSLVDYQLWAVDAGLMDEPVPIDGFWDPSLLEDARARLAEQERRAP